MQFVCTFAFAHAKIRVSHDVAHLHNFCPESTEKIGKCFLRHYYIQIVQVSAVNMAVTSEIYR